MHKFQKLSSIIPFYSTMFILMFTMIELKRRKASIKRWLQFLGVLVLTFLAVFLINNYVLSGEVPIINWIVAALWTTLANFLMVDIQKKAWQEQPDNAPNKSSKKIEIGALIGLGVWLSLAIVMTLVVCLVLFIQFSNPYHAYEDTNGPSDTSLEQITEKEIVETSDSYYGWCTVFGTYGEQTEAQYNWSATDYDRVRRSWKHISGVQTLQATKINEGTLCLTITSEVVKGNMEIFVLVDGIYRCSVPVNGTHTITLNDIGGKIVLVRMGCEAAEMDITVERTILE